MAISYKDSGVDVERGYKAVKLMREHVQSTYTSGVLGDIGSFGGFFKMPEGMKEPVLVAGTDGVGTKLKYAFIADKHDTIGIDAVAMCVNDIVCQGAKPLFFLDYFATGNLSPEVVATVVSGVAEGCRQSGAALIGGETAEMPGFYQAGEYDIAGFAVGVVDKEKVINGKDIKEGDILIGIKSSGIHSNGYSLVRKLWGEDKAELEKYDERLGCRIIDALLTIPRIFPEGIGCEIDTKSYEVPELFRIMQEKAEITDAQIYNTFNMGIGMVVCVDKKDVDATIAQLESTGEKCAIIGKTIKGSGVTLF